LLSGCDVVDGVSAEGMLSRMSDFNDRVQAWLFKPHWMDASWPCLVSPALKSESKIAAGARDPLVMALH